MTDFTAYCYICFWWLAPKCYIKYVLFNNIWGFFLCVYFDKEEKKVYDTIWQRCRTMQYCNAFEMSHLKAYIKAIFCQHWHVVLIASLSRHRVAAVHRTRQYSDEFFFGFSRTKFSKKSRLFNSDSQSITIHSYLGQPWCFARLRAHAFNSIHLLHSCTFSTQSARSLK